MSTTSTSSPASPQRTHTPSKSRSNNKGEDTNPDYNLSSIGNYNFIKTVGEGNFAKVKLSKHKLTSLEVAIKMIDKTQIDETKLTKLYREVRIMKMLHHPNIVQLYEVIETKHSVFLIMEYASGGELYDYLVVHGKMKEKEAREKFRQILSGVYYCHKKHVIHRDLKAENLLLDGNFDIKIADFGFSNLYNPNGQLDTFCGSPPYAAPELFQGQLYTGPEVDVWSLGVILYVLTTGALPFDGKTLSEMRQTVCRGKYRVPFYMSEGIEKCLRKMLIKDPAKRESLSILSDDSWLNHGYEKTPFDDDLSVSVTEDESIFKTMESKFKITRESVISSLHSNQYDDISAIYYLLYTDREAARSRNSPGNNSGEIEYITSSVPEKSAISSSMGKASPIEEAVSYAPSSPAPVPSRNKAARSPLIAQTVLEDSPLVTPMDSPKIAGRAPQPIGNAVDNPEVRQIASGAGRRRRFTVGDEGKKEIRSSISPPTSPLRASIKKEDPALTNSVGGYRDSSIKDSAPSTPTGTRTRRSTLTSIFKSKVKPENVTDEKPRSLRFTFNSRTTSTKSPEDLLTAAIQTCVKLAVKIKPVGKYTLECSPGIGVTKFEIEICRLPRLSNVHGLKFKRLSGSSSEYKAICEKFLETVQL